MNKLITAVRKTGDNKLAISITGKNRSFLQSSNDCQLLCHRPNCQFERRHRRQRKCQSQFFKAMLKIPLSGFHLLNIEF